ncbi:MAG: S1C family serine protease [Bryobacteraceae bacterium]
MALPVPGRVVEALRRSTVEVLNGSSRSSGSGTGTVVTEGQVVTNAHVVRGASLTVASWEGDRLPASVLRIDGRRDLALLKIQGLRAPASALGDSNALRPGTPIVAVGNPLGFVGAVSSGVVHAVGAAPPMGGQTAIYADVRLAPGNSGGPLADYNGQVVGINTMVISGGLALAIPSRAVQLFVKRTRSGSSLGVVVRQVALKDKTVGMMILEVSPGGAAERASLLPGDVLVGANQSRFRMLEDLEAVTDEAPGSVVVLEFYRAGQRTMRRVALQLERKPNLSAA